MFFKIGFAQKSVSNMLVYHGTQIHKCGVAELRSKDFAMSFRKLKKTGCNMEPRKSFFFSGFFSSTFSAWRSSQHHLKIFFTLGSKKSLYFHGNIKNNSVFPKIEQPTAKKLHQKKRASKSYRWAHPHLGFENFPTNIWKLIFITFLLLMCVSGKMVRLATPSSPSFPSRLETEGGGEGRTRPSIFRIKN